MKHGVKPKDCWEEWTESRASFKGNMATFWQPNMKKIIERAKKENRMARVVSKMWLRKRPPCHVCSVDVCMASRFEREALHSKEKEKSRSRNLLRGARHNNLRLSRSLKNYQQKQTAQNVRPRKGRKGKETKPVFPKNVVKAS